MTILLTTDTVGGVWTFTETLTKEYLKLGHSVTLISLGSQPSDSQAAWCRRTKAAHLSCFNFVSLQVPLEWMQANQSAFKDAESYILEQLRLVQPDIFHSNQFCHGAVDCFTPVVITAHSDVLSWGAACKVDLTKSSGWLNCYEEIVSRGLRGADAVVAPTRWMLTALQNNFDFPAVGHVIHNGCEQLAYDHGATKALQAISAGRMWDPAKNLLLLSSIRPSIPLLIAGETCDSETSISSTTANLRFLGHMCRPEVLDLFRRSSIYIASSVYEPFGLAPLEAAMCGCAILANSLPTLHEVWEEAALFFSTATELEVVLDRLVSDPQALHEARNAAIKRAAIFTAEKTARSYLALYRTLLDPQTNEATCGALVDAC